MNSYIIYVYALKKKKQKKKPQYHYDLFFPERIGSVTSGNKAAQAFILTSSH